MIPKRLLIHAISYSEPSGYDRDGNAVYTEAQDVQFVRLAPVLAAAKDSAGETKNDKLTVYIDPAITYPAIVPVENARIIWHGAAFTIREVKPCYTQGTEIVHHYEAALI